MKTLAILILLPLTACSLTGYRYQGSSISHRAEPLDCDPVTAELDDEDRFGNPCY